MHQSEGQRQPQQPSAICIIYTHAGREGELRGARDLACSLFLRSCMQFGVRFAARSLVTRFLLWQCMYSGKADALTLNFNFPRKLIFLKDC